MDIDAFNNAITLSNPNSPTSRVLYGAYGSSTNLYYVVMVSGGGSFTVDQDISFLQQKWTNASVSFSSDSATVVNTGTNMFIVGDSIDTTQVNSFQITLNSFGGSICFGIMDISDLTTFSVNSGSFAAGTFGACADSGTGSNYQVTFKCPCLECAAECSSCSGPLKSQCSQCRLGYYLQPDGVTCEATCPDGYNSDILRGYCCDQSCVSCTGPNNYECSQCITGYFLQPNGSACDLACPLTHTEDEQDNICCNAACARCYSSNDTSCFECNPGYFLQPNSLQCLTTCPTGYFTNPAANNCSVNCDVACSACWGASNSECSQCSIGYFLQPDKTTCLPSCPSGYTQDSINRNCTIPCHSTCEYCTGPNSNQCTSCPVGSYLQLDGSSCDFNCPSGYIPNATARMCTNPSCDYTCSVCTGSASTYKCLSCLPGYFLQPDYTCDTSCPFGYSQDTVNRVCTLICDLSCAVCTGSSSNECSSCNNGFFLQPNGMSCDGACPSGYSKDSINNRCCDISCNVCSGLKNYECTSCTTGYFLAPNGTACIKPCPEGYWENSNGNTCTPCHYSCLACHGDSNQNCSACADGFVLKDGSTCIYSTDVSTIFPAMHPAQGQAGPAAIAFGALMKIENVMATFLPLVLAGTGSVSYLALNFIGDLELFKFINVPYPDNYNNFSQAMNSRLIPSFLSYTYDHPSLAFVNVGNFGVMKASGVFFDNAGSQINKFLLVLCTSLLLLGLGAVFKSNPTVIKLRDRFCWSGLLATYIADFQIYLAYTLMHMKTSAQPIFSLIFGIFTVFIYLASFAYFAYLLKNRKKPDLPPVDRRRRPNTGYNSEFEGTLPKGLSMLTEEFQQKNWFSRNFILVYSAQNALTIIILVFLQASGVAQAVFYVLFALVSGILAIGIFRTMKSWGQIAVFTASQVVKMILGSIALMLGVKGQHPENNQIGVALIAFSCIGVILNMILPGAMIFEMIMKKHILKDVDDESSFLKSHNPNLERLSIEQNQHQQNSRGHRDVEQRDRRGMSSRGSSAAGPISNSYFPDRSHATQFRTQDSMSTSFQNLVVEDMMNDSRLNMSRQESLGIELSSSMNSYANLPLRPGTNSSINSLGDTIPINYSRPHGSNSSSPLRRPSGASTTSLGESQSMKSRQSHGSHHPSAFQGQIPPSNNTGDAQMLQMSQSSFNSNDLQSRVRRSSKPNSTDAQQQMQESYDSFNSNAPIQRVRKLRGNGSTDAQRARQGSNIGYNPTNTQAQGGYQTQNSLGDNLSRGEGRTRNPSGDNRSRNSLGDNQSSMQVSNQMPQRVSRQKDSGSNPNMEVPTRTSGPKY